MKNEKDKSSHSVTRVAWQRFRKNRLSMLGLILILFFIVLAVLGYLITPDSTPDANQQLLEISKNPPGFEVQILMFKKNETTHYTYFLSKMLFGEISDYRSIPIISYRFEGENIFYKEFSGENKHVDFEKKICIADVVFALKESAKNKIKVKNHEITFYELEKEQPTTKTIAELQYEIANHNIIRRKFWLGTDPSGRDLLSRLILGTRVSFSVGFISVFISLFIGLFIGAIAGYYRGKLDNAIIWIINVVWSIPTLLLVIAITLALGKGLWQVFIAVGMTMWVDVARVIRGQVISIREKDFVEAARALGFSDFRIIFRQILPNVMGPVIVISAANFASAILIEAGLSFLGIGAQPPTASWGEMINSHREFIMGQSPFLAILPGVAIVLIVLSFVLLGNGLRDALDTKMKEQSVI
ncbi:MAG: ABC transporter permease [Bacteroidota bacterium]